MTTEEFSNGFDTLLHSYKHNVEFGEQSSIADINLDEYEKSLFLTQAQDIVVKSYFNRAFNSNGEGFDDSTRRQMDFSNLITIKTFDFSNVIQGASTYSENGIVLDLSETNALFIINEKVTTSSAPEEKLVALTLEEINELTTASKINLFLINGSAITLNDASLAEIKKGSIIPYKKVVRTLRGSSYVVVPINYKEYDRMMSKAYAEPLKRQAWRLFGQHENSTKGNTELIFRSDAGTFSSYKIRYVRRPRPIVLVDLTNTENQLAIDGVTEITECELNPIIHQEILQEAVRLVLMTNGIETREMRALREQNK